MLRTTLFVLRDCCLDIAAIPSFTSKSPLSGCDLCRAYKVLFLAVISAEITKSSAPDPGNHWLMIALLSSFNLSLMSRNPAAARIRSSDSCSGAPVTQQASASAVFSRSGIT